MAAPAEWPTCQQLQCLVEEQSLDELAALAADGVEGLCRRLGSDPQRGLPSDPQDFGRRLEAFGGNWTAEKRLTGYHEYVWEALHDKIIMLLLVIGTVELVVKMAFRPEERQEGWIEPLAIYLTVAIIVNVQSTMDYRRERLFDRLSKKLAASNLRFVIRSGNQVTLSDNEIVVGDILAFNSHLAATIPADGILVSGSGIKMDESALTGETEQVAKDAECPFIISGTTVVAGQGKMLVVAVGDHSVSGKIKKAVYDEEADEESPLFEKLDRMAKYIGHVGTIVASLVFAVVCIQGFAIHHRPADKLIDYLLLSLGVLAVAVPEGLPLALTISLAISSNKMANQHNLVKTLASCETMGSVTTICTDKTGTLTANRMTVMASCIGGVMSEAEKDSPVGLCVKNEASLCTGVKELSGNLICICTMDESQIGTPEPGKVEPKFHGNPTECAMLKFAEDCGFAYADLRQRTVGRSEATHGEGSVKPFSSARKMMSWAVPRPEGGFRVYAKGASEIIVARVASAVAADGQVHGLTDADRQKFTDNVIVPFAKRSLRTIGMAYKDVEEMPNDVLHEEIQNTDGTCAFECETGLTLVGVLGIADPLRGEVPHAIQQCYRAGIDVRMVTGDNLETAIAIARQAGILDENLHFDASGTVKPFRAMEGRAFRRHVHQHDENGQGAFLQEKFDEVWPYLRVLARSSPEDKLTLATGLSGSKLFLDRERARQLEEKDGISIFPDRQVIAMTGDGTNDAPALRAACVGFAMGIAGTQIAKDAADIILLDDNFASIVTAAKWGRNVFDSIQKFLQFQLTVNIAVLVITIISSFADLDPPLKLLHLLWINMIMDSLASIALASEPPTEQQLKRPPVNRSNFIITGHMWFNMLGQAIYQVTVVVVLLYKRDILPGCEEGTGPDSKHYTILFNVFVLMQLFNEYNSRFLLGEWNIFKGLLNNPTFLTVSAVTFALQILMAQFGSKVLRLHREGLDGDQWALCLCLGAGSLVWQPVINLAKRLADFFVAGLKARANVRPRASGEPDPNAIDWGNKCIVKV